MPAAFLGHVSPMNALETSRFTTAWRAFGAGAAKPRAILMASAHWYVSYTAVTAMARPHTIQSHSDFGRAVPTPDHFIPLLYLAGLADAERCPAKVLVDGYSYGKLSMTSYALHAGCPDDRDGRPAAGLPDPSIVLAEDTNT